MMKTSINLFASMKRNLAEKDERIRLERNRISLSVLRITQFALIGIQLFGLISTYFTDNIESVLYLHPIVYILLLLPFVLEPLIACARGFLGASGSDAVFFVIGLIEAGYIAYEIACIITGTTQLTNLIMIPVGIALYYTACVIMFNVSSKRTQIDDE